MPAMYVPRYSVPGCAGSTASACMIPPCGPSEVHDVACAPGATAIPAAAVTHVIHVRARDRGIAGPSRRAPYPAGWPGVNEKRPRSASAAAELRPRRRARERSRHTARAGLPGRRGIAEDDRSAQGTGQRADGRALGARAEVEVARAAHAVLELVEPL